MLDLLPLPGPMRTDTPKCPTPSDEPVSVSRARRMLSCTLLARLLARGRLADTSVVLLETLVLPNAVRLARPSYGDRLTLSTSVLIISGLELLPR